MEKNSLNQKEELAEIQITAHSLKIVDEPNQFE